MLRFELTPASSCSGHASCNLHGLADHRAAIGSLSGRGVPADVAYELFAQGDLNHARVHTLHQLAAGKLIKGPAEGGITWPCITQIESAQAAQLAVGVANVLLECAWSTSPVPP